MSSERLARLARAARALAHESAFRSGLLMLKNRLGFPVSARLPEDDGTPIPFECPSTPVDVAPNIPGILFQTWKSRTTIPARYRYWRQTFIANNPGHQLILWDDADNRRFIAERFPWFVEAYDAYPAEIFRADAVRFFFLFEYGGLYADMDTECLRPVDRSLAVGDVVLGRMGQRDAFQHSLPNAIMASRPGQIFWIFAISVMWALARAVPLAEQRRRGPEAMTGPVLLKHAYDRFVRSSDAEIAAEIAGIVPLLDDRQRDRLSKGTVVVLPSERWYPLDWTNPIHRRLWPCLTGRDRVGLRATVLRSSLDPISSPTGVIRGERLPIGRRGFFRA